MSDSTLRYVALELDDMHEPGTCTVRRCTLPDGSKQWRLWFVVRDEIGEDAGAIVLLTVALNVNGEPLEGDRNSRRWGFTRIAPGQWQVAPSIDVANVWHHTPTIIDAPEPAPWV